MKASKQFKYFLLFILLIMMEAISAFSQPTLITPANNDNCVKRDTCLFLWNKIAGSVSYMITISTNSDLSSPIVDHFGMPDTNKYYYTLPKAGQKYYWMVTGVTSSPPPQKSAVWSFTTLDTIINLSPANGINCASKTTLFKWSTVSTATYTLQISTSNQFTSFVLNQSGLTTDTMSYTLPNYNTTYFWRVFATTANCVTDYSPAFSLTTQKQPPVLTTPANNLSAQNVTGMRFKWTISPNPSTSVLQIATDSTFPLTSIFYEGIKTGFTDTVSNFEYNTTYYWRVNADYSGCATPWSLTTYKFRTQYSTPTNILTRVDSCTPAKMWFTWDTIPGVSTYRLQASENKNFTTLVLDKSGITGGNDNDLMPKVNQKYYFRLRAEDSQNAGAWTPLDSFFSSDGYPYRINPSNNAKNQPLTLTFKWIKPNPTSIERIQISADNAFATLFLDSKNITDDTLQVTFPTSNKIYYWRMSTTANACFSLWSDTWSFTTGVLPPHLINPDMNATNQSQNITFEWQACEGATSYEFMLASDMFFSKTSIIKGSTGVINTKYPVANLNIHTNYYWKVRAANANGNGDWSEIYKFTTGSKALEIPNLTSPPNGKANLSNVKVNLEWDPVPEFKRYNIQFNDKSDFSKPLVDIPDLPVNNHSVTSLKYNTIYYWRVKATNDSSQSDWSPTWTFKTSIQYPTDAAVLIAPPNKANDVTINLEFDWQAVPRAENYDLQISKDMSFSAAQMFLYDSVVPSNTRYVTGLHIQDTYFWRTRGKNGSGEGPWSETWSFTTSSTSVNDIIAKGIEINPNPASDYIEILVPVGVQLAIPKEIEIYDILGVHYTLPSPLLIEGEQLRLDVSGLAPGVYFLKIGDRVQRFVKM